MIIIDSNMPLAHHGIYIKNVAKNWKSNHNHPLIGRKLYNSSKFE